jgi:hypothetical protein
MTNVGMWLENSVSPDRGVEGRTVWCAKTFVDDVIRCQIFDPMSAQALTLVSYVLCQ